ncbi:FAD-dependent monooxygenase [Oleiharenicola lentus]|uniref:FAD-dependent monooxygenase n=1 Tax=Oleiharenicola lentus TaxID=2508720 RepID=UPI003F675630
MSAADVLIIGSGPAGAMAAAELVARGFQVTLIDYGADDPTMRARVPDQAFHQFHTGDQNQRGYLLGDKLEGIPRTGVRVGAQLTPPRQFVGRDADTLLPIHSENFHPMQSLALGGLGAAWGTACFTYSAEELARIGLDRTTIEAQYGNVIEEAGINGPQEDDISRLWWSGIQTAQPPLDIDTNSANILSRYQKNSQRWMQRGFALGRIPLAINTRPHRGREANPYFDTDFYGDVRRSAYRPRYTIERLQQERNFRYERHCLSLNFAEDSTGVTVTCVRDGSTVIFKGRRLILCAGAIGSARLALASLPLSQRQTTVLSSAYLYYPTLNLRMLGRPTDSRRHSMAQLTALYGDFTRPERTCSLQVYSYRSLLLFKLIKEMPLAPWAGLLVSRAMVDALAIFGAFFPDEASTTKRLRLGKSTTSPAPDLHIEYTRHEAEQSRQTELESGLRRCLLRLGCMPLGRVDPGQAGSIHYAGTIPQKNPVNPQFHTLADSRLGGTSRVFVGDSASWNWLPSKGPTFTAMAGARAVAGRVAESLAQLA